MKLYCGIDLHANNSVISIQDEQDNVRYEKRLPNDLGVIVSALQPFTDGFLGRHCRQGQIPSPCAEIHCLDPDG